LVTNDLYSINKFKHSSNYGFYNLNYVLYLVLYQHTESFLDFPKTLKTKDQIINRKKRRIEEKFQVEDFCYLMLMWTGKIKNNKMPLKDKWKQK
jgi:hypothetical protein